MQNVFFIHKKTEEVYAYSSHDAAKLFHEDYDLLIECSEPPSSQFRQFNFESQKWGIDIDAQNKALENENIAKLEYEQSRTEAEIKIYERMRDRNRADEDDIAMLELLEDYSIDLKKVTKQQGWPLEVEWPIAPDF